LPTVHVMPYSDVSTYHILWSDLVLIESSAIGEGMEPLAEARAERPSRSTNTPARPSPVVKKAAAKKSPAKTAAKKVAKPAAKKATKSTAAKKPAAKKAAAKKKGK